MSIIDHSSYTTLPLEAELIGRAQEIEQALRDGQLVTYDEMDELDDMRRDDMNGRLARAGLALSEVNGDGYRAARTEPDCPHGEH